MSRSLKDTLLSFLRPSVPEVKRHFNIQYLPNDADFENYKKYGYVLLKNVIRPLHMDAIRADFEKLTTFDEYQLNEKFINSGRFSSPVIRNFVMNAIGDFSQKVLPEIFITGTYDPRTTGAFQIKPPSGKSELNPHQDSPVIDETRQNALFVWIPLCDITEENGPVWVLPGSHLWGNHQRSLNVPWVFEPHTKTLWKQMFPVTMKQGDVLCWDTALIHASSPNLSKALRVALTTTLLPKDYRMVEYFSDAQTPEDEVEKYEVERSFWESEDILKRPPCPPNQFLGYEKKVFASKISKLLMMRLLAVAKKF